MHSTSSKAWEWFWAPFEETVFNLQLARIFTTSSSPSPYKKYIHATLYLNFLPRDLLLHQDKKTPLVSPYFQGNRRSNYSYFWEWKLDITLSLLSARSTNSLGKTCPPGATWDKKKLAYFFLSSAVALFLTKKKKKTCFSQHNQNPKNKKNLKKPNQVLGNVTALTFILYTHQLMSRLRTCIFHLSHTRGLPVTIFLVQS